MTTVNQNILITGTDVVMGFPGNTVSQRDWFRSIYSGIEGLHELIYTDLSDDSCLRQIEKRRIQQPERAVTDTKKMFEEVTKYFEEPMQCEGFKVTRVERSE